MKSLFFMFFVFIAILIIPAMIAFLGFVGMLEHQTLYRPQREIHSTPASVKLRFQEVHFTSADGTGLHGWWIPADRAAGTVLYCHGNGGNIADVVQVAQDFHSRRLNLLLWDYRGYGKSSGRPGERGIRADALAAYDAAVTLSPDVPIIIYGFSLGGAVAAQLAADRQGTGGHAPAALIIESSFASAADIAKRWHPHLPLWLLRSKYDSAAAVARLSGLPKLFAHSPDDDVLPWETGRLLFEHAAEPKSFATLSGTHLTSSWRNVDGAGRPELDAFLQHILAAPPASDGL